VAYVDRSGDVPPEKEKQKPGGVCEKCKINVTLDYPLLRGGVKIKGGVKLSIIYGTANFCKRVFFWDLLLHLLCELHCDRPG
jgi:hypothetical protein